MTGRERATLLLFVGASFAAAFLIFLVQPMVGKRILPWFGGVPAVWALCLAFFQSTLFAGYAYAHLLIRYARPGAQLALHAGVCAAALLALPVLPEDAWMPAGSGEPTAAILAMLGANVALPFLVLAGTGPLVQAWFARIHPERSPYPLYAVSNFGSLAALLGYPFLIEPRFSLSASGNAWSAGFALTAAAVLGCAAAAWRLHPGRAPAPRWGTADTPLRLRALWMLLPGCAVVLLMGVTNELCTDTASVPFLWILPLATYLATFILCFGLPRAYRRTAWVVVTALAFVLPELLEWSGGAWGAVRAGLSISIARYLVLLFGACTILHGELHRLRPDAADLTAYYLSLSFGGALGGILAGVAAPHLFTDYYELVLGMAAVWLLLIAAAREDPASWLRRGGPRWRLAGAGAAAGAIAAFGLREVAPVPGLLHQERSFFGVLRVAAVGSGTGQQIALTHGTTLHGFQYPLRPRMPTSYYARRTGIGLALSERAEGEAWRVGVVGLGVGTLAAYGRAGDRFRFYEIDPAVIRLARDQFFFSFLRQSAAEIEIVAGDARISLEAERAGGRPRFDWLIVDAYSSDALPVHLLTREALALYADSLEPQGVVAFHVSSRNFDLLPLLSRLAGDAGLEVLVVESARQQGVSAVRSRWVFLCRDAERLAALAEAVRRQIAPLQLGPEAYEVWRVAPGEHPEAPLWTDDYSDLLGVLKR